jgi:hypothetical protein
MNEPNFKNESLLGKALDKEKHIQKEVFAYEKSAPNNKKLLPKLLNRNIYGSKNVMFIRESLSSENMYEVHVHSKENTHKYIYASGRSSATSVLKAADRFDIILI